MRMRKEITEYEFKEEDAFFSEGQWFLFVTAVSEDDILITVKEDENRYVTEVGISALNTGKAAANAFVFAADTDLLFDKTGVFDRKRIFSEDTYFAEDGRFKLSFFNADMGSTVLLRIDPESGNT